jgi:hypothetical protein
MTWVSTAIAGASLISGIFGKKASKKAAKRQAAGDAAAIVEQRRQFDTIMGFQQPYRTAGTGALNQISQLYGLPTDASGTQAATSPAGPDLSVFTASPDYQFRQREGVAAIDRSAASRGGALSGNAVRAQTEYASDLASTEFGDFFSRLATIAGIGQNAANASSNAASATGSNVSQLLSAQGTARASGVLGQANSITGALNSGLNNYLLLRGGYFGGGAPAGVAPGGGGGGFGRSRGPQ